MGAEEDTDELESIEYWRRPKLMVNVMVSPS